MNTERLLQAGDLDPVFNGGYVDLSHTGPWPGFLGLVNTADGGVLALSYQDSLSFPGYFVTKFTPLGTLDQDFASGEGFFYLEPEIDNLPWAIHGLEDGSFLVMGWIQQTLVASRFNPDGSLDTSYGANGYAVVHVPDLIRVAGKGAPELAVPATQTRAPDTAGHRLPPLDFPLVFSALDDERLYLIFTIGWGLFHEKMTVALRLDAQGQVDTTFGDTGYVVITLAGTGIEYNKTRLAFVQQQDDKPRQLVVAVQESIRDAPLWGDVYMVRFDEAGRQDFSFGAPDEGGVVRIARSQLTFFTEGRADQSGAIKLVGQNLVDGNPVTALRGYSANGEVDTAFNNGETLLVPIEMKLERVQICALPGGSPDARILLSTANIEAPEYIVVRLLADGAFDTTFGTDGIVALDLHHEGKPMVVGRSLEVLPNGDLSVSTVSGIYRLLGNAS